MSDTFSVINHPSLVVTALDVSEIMSMAGGFLWPKDQGPFENLLRFADWGTWLVGGPVFTTIVILASVLGYDFQALGRWLDKTLGTKKFEDILQLNLKDAIDKILGGFSAEELNEMQEAAANAGIIKAPATTASLKAFPLVRNANQAGADQFGQLLKAAENPREMARNNPAVLKAKEKYGAIINDPRVSPKAKAKAQEKFNAIYARALTNAKEKSKYMGQSRMERFFPKGGSRGKAVMQAAKYKGISGGILVALTSLLGWAKDIAAKLAKAPFKLVGKAAMKHPLLTILGTGIAGAYYFFKDDDEPELVSEVAPGESVFTEGVSRHANEAAKSKGMARKAPGSFEEKVAFEVDSIMSQAMGV